MIFDSSSDARHEHIMVHAIEEFLEVHIDDPAIPRRNMAACGEHRLMRAAAWTKSEAPF